MPGFHEDITRVDLLVGEDFGDASGGVLLGEGQLGCS
jgi:hypothetical protein